MPSQPTTHIPVDAQAAAIERQTGHVHVGDKSAEFVDRRNQVGQPFDENVNEYTTGTVVPNSDAVTDLNRYSDVDKAQTRTINADGSIPNPGSE